MSSENQQKKSILSLFFQKTKTSARLRKIGDMNHRLISQIYQRGMKIPRFCQMRQFWKILSKREKRLINALLLLITIAIAALGARIYWSNSKQEAAEGGEYVEGIVGEPRFINPALSETNEADADLVSLIYSGLLRFNEKLELEPDIALSYDISPDQKKYTFHLNEHVFWHDGEPLNAEDVLFTMKIFQDPEYHSPLQSNFTGVLVEKIDDETVTFTLKEPFAPFLNSLTFGILPAHKWDGIEPKNFSLTKLNLKPVGAGPFVASAFKQDELGRIRSYTLARNENYYGERSYLDKVTLLFYPEIDSALNAFRNKNILGLGFIPKDAKKSLMETPTLRLKSYALRLPQYTALFLNPKHNIVLEEANLRKALAQGIDRDAIIEKILGGEGELINGPILPGFVGYQENLSMPLYDFDQANAALDTGGWKKISASDYVASLEDARKKQTASLSLKAAGENKEPTKKNTPQVIVSDESARNTVDAQQDEEFLQQMKTEQEFYRKKGNTLLTINLTTVDFSENKAVAEMIRESWKKLGVRVDLRFIPVAKILSEVIKPREYDILLYGETVGSDPDPYPYWHSSQIKDPGLNLSSFSNKRADTLLEEARLTSDKTKRAGYYQEFQEILDKELPAIFLYYPTYTYIIDQSIQNVNVSLIHLPQDRFADITQRFLKMKRIFHWKGWKENFWP